MGAYHYSVTPGSGAAAVLGSTRRAAFVAGYREWSGTLPPAADDRPPPLERFGQALDLFATAVPALKNQLIRACMACVVADRQLTAAEYELLRAICSSLDSPLPSLTARSPLHLSRARVG